MILNNGFLFWKKSFLGVSEHEMTVISVEKPRVRWEAVLGVGSALLRINPVNALCMEMLSPISFTKNMQRSHIGQKPYRYEFGKDWSCTWCLSTQRGSWETLNGRGLGEQVKKDVKSLNGKISSECPKCGNTFICLLCFLDHVHQGGKLHGC